MKSDGAGEPWLLSRTGSFLLALPLEQVIEVMRVLPIESLAGVPEFVRGVSIVRGAAVPVIDAGLLLGARHVAADRLISVRSAGRRYGLLVGAVIGVRRFTPDMFEDPPPLLRHVAEEVVSSIGRLDEALVLFLGTARVVPEVPLDLPAEARDAL